MAKEPEVPTSSHFTSPEKATPRAGQGARGGVSRLRGSEAEPAAARRSSRSRRDMVPEDDRRQTCIGLRAEGAGRSRRLPYDYVLGVPGARPGSPDAPDESRQAATAIARAGSRSSAMIRAAMASSSVRSGGVDPVNGRFTSNPSSARRGITWTW